MTLSVHHPSHSQYNGIKVVICLSCYKILGLELVRVFTNVTLKYPSFLKKVQHARSDF